MSRPQLEIGHFNGQVPILLGVSGHRNIDMENKALSTAIRQQCATLRKQYPDSPFVILSSLAEGADRLVARIAIDELDAALIAVLPLPSEDYAQDFETSASKEQFYEFIAHAFCVIEAPSPQHGDSWKYSGETRNEQYARAGAIIADHAEVLFAVWDGEQARGTGGTAEIVGWFKRGFAPPNFSLYKDALSPLDPPEPGQAIIFDPKTGKTRVLQEPGYGGQSTSEMRNTLTWINNYNRDITEHRLYIHRSYPLAPDELLKNTRAGFTEAAYHAADGLSVAFARNVRRADLIIYSFALFAFLSFSLLRFPVASWVYLGLTLVMLLLGERVRISSIDNRFLEYRSLAEAMRVMFFWRVAGIRRPVWLAYLSRHSGVVHWIRHAVRTLEFCQECLLPRGDRAESHVTPDGLKAVKTHWIDDQIQFFIRGQARHRNRYRRLGRIAPLCIGASFVIAGLIAVLAIFWREDGDVLLWDPNIRPWVGYLQMSLGLLAAFGLVARGFLYRRADLELTKQYTSQLQIFEIAKQTLAEFERSTRPEWSAEQILIKLGEEALDEQAEWLWLRHSRPFEVPM